MAEVGIRAAAGTPDRTARHTGYRLGRRIHRTPGCVQATRSAHRNGLCVRDVRRSALHLSVLEASPSTITMLSKHVRLLLGHLLRPASLKMRKTSSLDELLDFGGGSRGEELLHDRMGDRLPGCA